MFLPHIFTLVKEFTKPGLALCLVVVGSHSQVRDFCRGSNRGATFHCRYRRKTWGEWRDGIYVHDSLSDYDLDRGWRAYIQSIPTIIPASGALGLTSYKDIYQT